MFPFSSGLGCDLFDSILGITVKYRLKCSVIYSRLFSTAMQVNYIVSYHKYVL